MSMDLAMPAAYAALVWWFTTGVILLLDGLPTATFRWSMAGATGMLALAVPALLASAADASPTGAYTAFTCAILVWGWLEMSFLMGFVTGPRRHACIGLCSGWRHFVHATGAVIYNELATAATGLAIFAATRHAPNRVAAGTYGILWIMRLSAKLNLFLGVPNVGEKLLPAHLQYLKGFFRKRLMNPLFPVSVTLGTAGVVTLARRTIAASDPGLSAGDALMTALLALAVLEHWFMVIPLPTETLWKWALRRHERTTPWSDGKDTRSRPAA